MSTAHGFEGGQDVSLAPDADAQPSIEGQTARQ